MPVVQLRSREAATPLRTPQSGSGTIVVRRLTDSDYLPVPLPPELLPALGAVGFGGAQSCLSALTVGCSRSSTVPLIPIPHPAHAHWRRSLHETATAVRRPRCCQRVCTARARYVCRFVGPARVLGEPGWSSPLCSCSVLGIIREVTRFANTHVGLLLIVAPHLRYVPNRYGSITPVSAHPSLVAGQTLSAARSGTEHWGDSGHTSRTQLGFTR